MAKHKNANTVQNIACVNTGSSSIKYELVIASANDTRTILSASFTGFNNDDGISIKFTDGQTQKLHIEKCDHHSALKYAFENIPEFTKYNIDAVAHRIVSAGPVKRHGLLNAPMMNAIEQASKTAPLHNPPAIDVINWLSKEYNVPHYAILDTAHFDRLAPLPLPGLDVGDGTKLNESEAYHGIAVADVCDMFKKGKKSPVVIDVHIGSGMSISVSTYDNTDKRYHGIWSTFEKGPNSGPLLMSTRSGSVPFDAICTTCDTAKMPLNDMSNLLNKKSGLSAIAGTADLISIERDRTANPKYAQAWEYWVNNVADQLAIAIRRAKATGSTYIIAFSGGVGENSSAFRADVLSAIGKRFDIGKNKHRSTSEKQQIGKDLYVCYPSETRYMAKTTMGLLQQARTR